jgi:DNA polymerase-1
MRPIAMDTETCLIRPALLAPPLVCVTWQEPGKAAEIEHHSTFEPRLRAWLDDPEVLFVLHNAAYDMAVFAERFPGLRRLIFDAYRADRVTDTMLRQQLLDIAAGVYRGRVDAKGRRSVYTYDLAALAKRCAGIEVLKDGWRTSYASFLDVPLERWPARALEVQAAARVRISELEGLLAEAPKDDKPYIKSLTSELEAQRAMVEGDASRVTTYALDDARVTLAVYQAQEAHAARYLKDQYRQTRAAFGLHLASAWGICVDGEGARLLREQIEAEKEELEDSLLLGGLIREDGTRDTKAARLRMIQVCREEGITIVRTDAHFEEKKTWAEREAQGLKPRCKKADGTPLDDKSDECEEHVGLDADACERSGDDLLIAYAERTTLTKQLSNDLPALEAGAVYPIHTRYGMAATGRSTSSKPNIQNQSNRPGFREAFVARPGFVFVQNDYPTLELYTLAQCCISWFGKSKLAEALRMGDPHLWVASIILNKPLDWCIAHKKDPEVVQARKLAKPANFGFPGGMGPPKFVTSTRKSLMKLPNGREEWETLALDEDAFIDERGRQRYPRVEQLKEQWLTAFPEMKEYFERVGELTDTDDGLASVETLFTGRWRGAATYCATSNNGFQALGADCAKNAVWEVAYAQYADKTSPLFDTRTVAFVHDELILECRDDGRAGDVALELANVMAGAANKLLPDIPIPIEKMEPTVMYRWSKKAKQAFDGNGRLIAWDAR